MLLGAPMYIGGALKPDSFAGAALNHIRFDRHPPTYYKQRFRN